MRFVKRSKVAAAVAATLAVVCLPAVLQAKKPADEALVKARQKYLGIENVDASGNVKGDKVIVSWGIEHHVRCIDHGAGGSCSTVTSAAPNCPTTPIDRRRVPILPRDFADAQPEAIFVGHGHGDHADNAATSPSGPMRRSMRRPRPAK